MDTFLPPSLSPRHRPELLVYLPRGMTVITVTRGRGRVDGTIFPGIYEQVHNLEVTVGLRDTKKARVRDDILKTARELFFTQGYRPTTMEAIAGRAGVAVGTVYNYFESKSAVLLAVTAKDTATALSGRSGLSDRASGMEILRDYLDTFMESLSTYPEKLLGELVRKTFGVAGVPSRSGTPNNSPTLVHGLESLIGRLVREGKLREDLDGRAASLVVYGIVMTTLMKYAQDRQMTPDRMMNSLDEMLESAYRGFAPNGDKS